MYSNRESYLSWQLFLWTYHLIKSCSVILNGSVGFTISNISFFTSSKATGSCPWTLICSWIAWGKQHKILSHKANISGCGHFDSYQGVCTPKFASFFSCLPLYFPPPCSELAPKLKGRFSILGSSWFQRGTICLCKARVVRVRGVWVRQTEKQNLKFTIKKICGSMWPSG